MLSRKKVLIPFVAALCLSGLQLEAFSLRGTRELCKRHRFKILAVASTAVVYLYTHKLIKKALQEHYAQQSGTEDAKNQTSALEYAEASADALVKVTKLLGTMFKVFRAVTCPDEGKVPGDQWLDDFSQMA